MPAKPKRDPAVERLVWKTWRSARTFIHDTEMVAMAFFSRDELQQVIDEARQSAARECAEIVEEPLKHGGLPGTINQVTRRDALVKAGNAIRQRFSVEGK